MTPDESDIEFDSLLAQASLVYSKDKDIYYNKIKKIIDPAWHEIYKKRVRLRRMPFCKKIQKTNNIISHYGNKIYMPNNSDYISSKEELAERLKCIRTHRGVCQQEIADYLEVHRSTYAYYEVAKTTPCIFTLIKLSYFYDIDIRYFIKENYKEDL